MKQALVFADRSGDELFPLNEHFSPAMLPVAGHPVLEYTLDRLQSRGIEQVFLIVPANDTQIRHYFETGVRWSLSIQYLSARSDDTPDRVRARLGGSLNAPFAALRGDVWRSPSSSGQDESAPYCGISEGYRNQYELWHNTNNSLEALVWEKTAGQSTESTSSQCGFRGLTSLTEYHQLATASADPGWWPSSAGRSEDLRSGALTRVHPVSLRDGFSCVGDFSMIELGAELSGLNSIGNHCFVARGAALKNAVILDNTFVGAGMRVENAIVVQQRVIRVDLNATLDIRDSFFLAPNRSKAAKNTIYQLLERVLAGLLLIAGFITSRIRQEPRRQSLERVQAHQDLKHALLGKIRLFGRPQSSRISDQLAGENYPWHEQFQNLPIGALSPASLVYPDATDPVLLSLAEIELNDRSSLRTLLKRGFRTMFVGSRYSNHSCAVEEVQS
ncbi:sugar phosphate nucleotidyltransferase [Marinobacter sp. F3R08]|uniref:sugar phosphate nucleotidyltransferase n=1 Tax=Marinobacter sp. F3R08 TaxID=2841559 RepID=UPI001C09A965|nr:sugar phosphate nucleotidyltransferase [Marinobacter sp. F3R08]MBU2955905.1 hypothetical protein [Marinobacter sp. F3R08]